MYGKIIRPCQKCLDDDMIIPATDAHHLLSQTKEYKKLYHEFIHHPDNIQYLCKYHHLSASVDKWTEKEFCDHFGIEPRSKSGVMKHG